MSRMPEELDELEYCGYCGTYGHEVADCPEMPMRTVILTLEVPANINSIQPYFAQFVADGGVISDIEERG